jgi:hypothetical protein
MTKRDWPRDPNILMWGLMEVRDLPVRVSTCRSFVFFGMKPLFVTHLKFGGEC